MSSAIPNNSALHEELLDLANVQVVAPLCTSSSEYVRDLIRRDRDSVRLRNAIVEGVRSGEGHELDAAYFDRLRARAHAPL